MIKRRRTDKYNDQKKKNRQIQWSKEKGQKDKQRSTKYTRKTKDRVTRTPLKPFNFVLKEISYGYVILLCSGHTQ